MSVAFALGRYAPPHKGHIETLVNLSKLHDKVIIGIGSCFELGTPRHPLLALFREKMIAASLVHERVDPAKYEFVYLQDFDVFALWFDHVMTIAKRKGTTHFVTGNKETVLDPCKDYSVVLPFEHINPETLSSYSFHSTDLRNAIMRGDYKSFVEMAAFGTAQLMGSIDGFNGLRRTSNGCIQGFKPGRQTVAVVFLLTDACYSRTYLLCGNRKMDKKYFPGYLALPGGAINDYESPLDACLRELAEETGIKSKVFNNTIEPAHILIQADNMNIMAETRFLNLFSSADSHVIGSYGGSSQVFLINVVGYNPSIFDKTLRSNAELDHVRFEPLPITFSMAYMYSEMVSQGFR
ncbi:MAG TPA: hypothetical protein DCZ10_13835 [Pelotomaculum sp.]|nr:hypothetical protein [Pelotomaculum sp.]